MRKCVVFIILLIMWGCNKNKMTNNINEQIKLDSINVYEGHFDIMRPICKNKSDENTDDILYRVGSLTKIGEDKVGFIDLIKTRVLVYSASNGKLLKVIGRKGGGPGEFMGVYGMKYFRNTGLLVIDLSQRKISIFDNDLNYVKQVSIKYLLDDIAIVDDTTWYVSSYKLQSDYKPIRTFNPTTEKYSESFGYIEEAQSGLYKKIEKSPFKSSDVDLFSHGWMTSLMYIQKTNALVYSQMNPYVLLRYDIASRTIKPFNVAVNYSTENNIGYEIKGDSRKASLNISGGTQTPFVYKDKIVIPVYNDKIDKCYLDMYNYDYTFYRRYKMPRFEQNITTLGRMFFIGDILYVHVIDNTGISWIEKMKFTE